MSTIPTLYVLAEEYRYIVNELANLDLPEDVVTDTLEGLSGNLEIKCTNIAMFARNLESAAEQIKAAEDQMARRRKAIEKRADHVREYLKAGMIHAGISKIECPYFKLSIRDNPPSVVIDNPAWIPAVFMRQPEPPPPAPDKKAIAETIKMGQDVPGCHLAQGKRLDIRV
jgi:hypothetical protein